MENSYTTEGAATLLGVSKVRVRQLIKNGRIPAEKRGRDHVLTESDIQNFAANGRKKPGRPAHVGRVSEPEDLTAAYAAEINRIGNGEIHLGDALRILPTLADESFQLIIADPPYFQVLLDHEWDNSWSSSDEYLKWTLKWVRACKRLLKPDGLFYIFGQLGKREHVWLHACSLLAKELQFHDMIIWDRAVGYNERYDSFTPQYEMILVLRCAENTTPYFNKDSVRIPYDSETIETYMRDKRYKNRTAREAHLRKGKYATNILRIPSLKGSSKEKIGHPSQKPIALINHIVCSSSRPGDKVLDPFLGSGTTAAACEALKRPWVGVEANSSFVEMARNRIREIRPEPELNFG